MDFGTLWIIVLGLLGLWCFLAGPRKVNPFPYTVFVIWLFVGILKFVLVLTFPNIITTLQDWIRPWLPNIVR